MRIEAKLRHTTPVQVFDLPEAEAVEHVIRLLPHAEWVTLEGYHYTEEFQP